MNKMSVCLQNNNTGPHLSSTVFLRKDVDNYVCGDQGCDYCFHFSEKELGSMRGCGLLSRCVADLGPYGPTSCSVLILKLSCLQDGNLFTNAVQIKLSLLWHPHLCAWKIQERFLGNERLGWRLTKTLGNSRCVLVRLICTIISYLHSNLKTIHHSSNLEVN